MAYRVLTTPAYEERFSTALDYRLKYYGRRSAERLVSAQEKAQSLLGGTPFMGTSLVKADTAPEPGDLRWVKVEGYIAVYRAIEDAKAVVLLDLFHTSENWRSRVAGYLREE